MRILFLDDDKNRILRFREAMIGHIVTTVETPEEAFAALDSQERFDIASLDHDLYGKVYQPSDEKSGFAVCEHIDNMDADNRPIKVICHSYNEDGAAAMAALLNGIIAPFDSEEYWRHFVLEPAFA